MLRQRRQRIEIPLDSIAGLHAWRLPLPGVGVDLRLASGRRHGQGLRIDDVHGRRESEAAQIRKLSLSLKSRRGAPIYLSHTAKCAYEGVSKLLERVKSLMHNRRDLGAAKPPRRARSFDSL